MEETKTPKPTYEQLEKVVSQFQQKVVILENKLRSIDFASMRLTWLFKVLENETVFPIEFVNKCTEEVKSILTIEEVSDTVEQED